jgi:hypothetical protein
MLLRRINDDPKSCPHAHLAYRCIRRLLGEQARIRQLPLTIVHFDMSPSRDRSTSCSQNMTTATRATDSRSTRSGGRAAKFFNLAHIITYCARTRLGGERFMCCRVGRIMPSDVASALACRPGPSLSTVRMIIRIGRPSWCFSRAYS